MMHPEAKEHLKKAIRHINDALEYIDDTYTNNDFDDIINRIGAYLR